MSSPIILASTSPRRRELLKQIGVNFEVLSSDASEDVEDSLSPIEVVRLLAERKAAAVASRRPDALIIASDTVVAVGGKILGKPKSRQDATQMLQSLSGRTHQVCSGVAFQCIERGINETLAVTTDVTFGKLSPIVIERYVDSGEPLDKAGAYGIQGGGAILVESINGSYYNVVGLPLFEVAAALERLAGETSLLQYD